MQSFYRFTSGVRRKEKGFTLIELLVVIALIGLLASIVVVSLRGPRVTARETKRIADMRTLQTAMELCYGSSDCGADEAYPTGANYGAFDLSPFVLLMPTDPQGTGDCDANGRIYCALNNTANAQAFCFWANLEEGGFYVASHVGTFEKTTLPSTLTGSENTSCENAN